MRTLFSLSAVLTLLLAAGERSWANDRELALAVIERGIKAHGGEEALGQIHIASRVAGGFLPAAGENVPFADEFLIQLPDRVRLQVVYGSGQSKSRMLVVVNGDKGWQSTGGAVTDMPKERLAEILEEVYVFWITTLVPLKTDNQFGLAPLAEVKVSGRPARGVKVTRKDRPDLRLWFDNETGLLVKIERKAHVAGKLAEKEYSLSDHKEFDGVLLATRRVETVNGKKSFDLTVTSYKILKQVDETLFAKP
jgi:hypothetical protein